MHSTRTPLGSILVRACRYFIQHTTASQELSRSARLVNMALKEAETISYSYTVKEYQIIHRQKIGGGDYSVDYANSEKWRSLSKVDKMKRIFKAIDEKNKEIKRSKSGR